jgi:hypothetical protein
MSVPSGALLHARQHTQHWSWFWRDVAWPFLLTRLLLTAVGIGALDTMHLPPMAWMSDTSVHRGWINVWSRWDSVWYLRIARDGYSYAPGVQSSVAFFPLYPLTMELGGYVFGHNEVGWLKSGIFASNALMLIAMAYLWKLVRLDFDADTARRAVLYALIFPTTLFFSAVYPMSLILAIAVAAFYYARTQEWTLTAAIAALAPLARPDGLILMPGLLFEYLRQRQFKLRQVKADVLLLALPLVTLACWMACLKYRFGTATAFLRVQGAWEPTTLRMALARDPEALAGVVVAALAGALLLFGWLRLRSSYMLYATLLWLVMVSAGRFASVPRFVLVLFPLYIALAIFGRKERFDRYWVIISSALAAAMMVRYSLCYFVG